MEQRFSTYLLDAALQRKRVEREECRKRLLDRTLTVLDLLTRKVQFAEAYVFGSLVKEGHYGAPTSISRSEAWVIEIFSRRRLFFLQCWKLMWT
jgi:hypothetical protein